jgi:hypothetical protein
MKLAQTLVLAGGLAASSIAAAHDDAYLATVKAPNGGQLRMAGPYHLELVLGQEAAMQDRPVFVYVTDHAGTKVSTSGASGTALILAGAKKSTVRLEPYGENALKGVAAYAGVDAKVIVSVALPGQAAQQARFAANGDR